MKAEDKLNELIESGGRGTATKLAEYLKVPRGYISRWASGTYRIPREQLPKIANFFGVDVSIFLVDDDKKTGVKMIPFIGKASCGVPSEYAYDTYDTLVPVPISFGDNIYYVEAEGDSMFPKIKNGDWVMCDLDKAIENGNIVHFTIDGESGIKVYKETRDGIYLVPINTEYQPTFYTFDELKSLQARFAKCVSITSRL